MRIVTFIALFCTVSTLWGTPNYDGLPDQAELFRFKHPDLAQFYEVLAPTSLAYILQAEETQYYFVEGLINGMRVRSEQSEETAQFLDRFQKINQDALHENREYVERLGRRIKETDRIFYFKYKRNYYRDFGLLVIRDGNIIFRDRSGYSVMPGTDLPEEAEVNFDKLSYDSNE
jgi:hypothetical protein